jgi:hypothetical protein
MAAADLFRAVLLLVIVAMAFLAIAYLRQRPLSSLAFLAWGLLAVLVPVIGPFVVIASRPGSSRRRSRLPRLREVRLR